MTRGIPVTVEPEVAVAAASVFATIVPIPLETILRRAYQLSGFTGPLRHLVSHADGEWWFQGRDNRIHVRWTYVFHPRMGRSVLVSAAIAPLWKRYQWRALMLAVSEAAKTAT